MRPFIPLFFLAFCFSALQAQTPATPATVDSSGNEQLQKASDTTVANGAGTDDHDKVFTRVEIESEFPGGAAAWNKFLISHFKYPKNAVKKNIQGTVIVQFIIAKDGSVTDIRAISGPDELRVAAENIIRQSPRWSPAMQQGRKLRSYKKQPLVFKLED